MSMQPDSGNAWSVRKPLTIGLITMLILIGGFGGWSLLTSISGAVVASGKIEVDRNRQAIQHPDGGVVAELHVREGDRVEAGDILLRIDAETLLPELAASRARLVELQVRRARLEAERDGAEEITFPDDILQIADNNADLADLRDGQVNLFEARRAVLNRESEQLRGRITQIETQVAALEAQEAALGEQIDLVSSDLARQQDLLGRGLTQSDTVSRLQREAAQLRGSLGELVARKAEAAERVIETELSITQLVSARLEEAISELREVRVAEEEQREQVALLTRRIENLHVRAPVTGTIHGLQVFGPQSVLRPVDPVAYLVPEGRPLIISAEVPAIDIDQVFVGQLVALKFPAFDMRTIPDLQGQVSLVSADAFTDEQTGRSFYRAEIVLEDGEAARLEDRTLVPGMPVEAFIRTSDRTPMAYLLEPISAYFDRAFREG